MQKKKSYWFGGLILCVFPAIVFLRAHLEEIRLPLVFTYFLWLLLLCGLWTVIASAFKLRAASAPAGAVFAVGFAGLAFMVAWRVKTGWSAGGLAVFIPESWTQIIPRILFALAGVGSLAMAVHLFRKARKNPKDI